MKKKTIFFVQLWLTHRTHQNDIALKKQDERANQEKKLYKKN